MTLDKWLSQKGWTYQRLADEIGCSHEYARLLAHRRRRPSLPTAQKIIGLTDGQVSLAEMTLAAAAA